ncbi:hypothetical protein Dimus_022478, partial [Dionaea muscipula]
MGVLTLVEDAVDVERSPILDFADVDRSLAVEGGSVAERGCDGGLVSGATLLLTGCMVGDDAMDAVLKVVIDGARPDSALSSMGVASSSLFGVLSSSCFGVEGMVRVERRAPLATKEALRQLPRSPEEPLPVSVVEATAGGELLSGGGGMVPPDRVSGDGGGVQLSR